MEVKGVGRRRTQLLDDLRNRRRYWELKEEAEYRKRWRRKRTLLNNILHRKAIGQMTEVKGVGRRRTQLLDDLRNRRRYWELKEEAELFYLFFHRRPTLKLCFLSCRPYVVNAIFSRDLIVSSVFWLVELNFNYTSCVFFPVGHLSLTRHYNGP